MHILFWRKNRFLVRADMFNTKFKNWNMRALGCYPVERGKDLALIKYAVGELKKNCTIIMFPEGMRAFNPEDALALRNGAAMIAIKAGVSIVPMVLKRAPRPFVFNALKIGTTISTEEFQNKKLEKSDLEKLSGKIQSSMAELLDGFEVKRKPKWWETTESVIARGIVIRDGKLLAVKRVRDGQEYYVLPGGRMDKGETAREAAAREVLEETNLECTPTRLLYKYDFKTEKEDQKAHWYGLQSYYYCVYKSGEVQITDAEEYTDTDRSRGTYEPVLLDIGDLKKTDLRPNCVRDQLIKDINKYGPNLARSPKYVK
jgi:1-acyl-sn-glycerol-3-phosphate acyltransferase